MMMWWTSHQEKDPLQGVVGPRPSRKVLVIGLSFDVGSSNVHLRTAPLLHCTSYGIMPQLAVVFNDERAPGALKPFHGS